MVHGGGFKPELPYLAELWLEALAAGLDRDFANEGGRTLLDPVRIEMIYYADLLEPLLSELATAPDATLDLADRRSDLARLAALGTKKKFRRIHYEALPGKSAVGEFILDVSAPLLTALNLAKPVLRRKVPPVVAYLTASPEIRAACEARLLDVLATATERREDVLLLSHALGSVVSYDALWRLSHEPEHRRDTQAGRIGTWITLGSPLASQFVKQRLWGAGKPLERRYPELVTTWYNVAAEDDYYCHDKTVTDDFGALLKSRRISLIKDYRIYNLAIRYGRSNPHNAVGYLIHPRVTRLVADWLMPPA